ncbi:G patch domain-containing protein 4 [Hondaea fermentalgiana]|uniref:G patch domain-containing protein 4 n=1 Tax=Hondaea fermentalgiana TaxID=2315210 RepID=A0A2R5G4F8_9STRA|nr:G patch domain-containing protein 4 [Hondaea fermentalgiana]|eukprot:GBG25907.1 G patch domain-containing protein 4 [Hondaea fermentalgiana]
MVHNGALVQKKTLQKLAGMSNERAAAPPSAFASDFLKRLGWQEGDGLGKDRGGRTSHVRVAMKDDVRGIGCKDESKEDFAGAWWSSGFDDALSKLQVATGNDGDDSDSSDSDSDSEHELEEDAKISIQLRDMSTYSEADRKLFIACGGRRPGQRAGRLQTGKIIREHLADKSFKAKLASIDPSKAREEFHKIAQTTIVTMKKAGADVKAIDTEAVEAAVAAAAEAIAEDTKKDKSKKKEKTKKKKDKTEKKEKTKKKRTRAEALEDESQDESEKEKKKAKKKAKKEKKEKSGKTEKKEKKEKKEKRKAKKVKGAAEADA